MSDKICKMVEKEEKLLFDTRGYTRTSEKPENVSRTLQPKTSSVEQSL
jgi:hypothetical protein